MIMHDYRIVVGVDGSEGSLRALRWAVHEAHTRGGTVRAITAYDWPGNEAALLSGPGPEVERHRAEDVVETALDDIRREYADVAITAEVQLGHASHKLAEAAEGANLLVLGSHGHSQLRHAILGSVSEACIQRAECPVVIIPTPHTKDGAKAT
jgi:nucleotide-binding universal stress UspA family protein